MSVSIEYEFYFHFAKNKVSDDPKKGLSSDDSVFTSS